MAPRTRSNRADKLEIQRLLASGKTPNSLGLAGLPNELFLEIMSHIPVYSLPKLNWIKDKYDSDRHFTLVSLSQTCQALRAFFLQHAWRRLEVRDGQKTIRGDLAKSQLMWRGPIRRRKRGRYRCLHLEEAARQLEMVTVRNSSLAEYVQEVDLNLPNKCSLEAIQEIAYSLSCLPNLHTLQLRVELEPGRGGKTTSPDAAFAKYTFANVHTLSLYSPLPALVNACPQLVRLFSPKIYFTGWAFPSGVVNKQSNIEVLGPLVSGDMRIADLVENFRQLRQIILSQYYIDGCLHQVSKLSELERLELVCIDLRIGRNRWSRILMPGGKREMLRDTFCKMLRNGGKKGSKKFIFVLENGKIESTTVDTI